MAVTGTRMWLILGIVGVLVLTLFSFVCYHFMWLPAWIGAHVLPIGYASVCLVAGLLFLVAIGYGLWTVSRRLSLEVGPRFALARAVLLLPVALGLLSAPIDRSLQLRAAHRANPLLRAIETYEREHESLPASLEELVPAYIDEIPRPDLLNAAMNQFVYESTSPGSQVPVPFTLAFGFHHPMAGNVAVVFCPKSAVSETTDEKEMILRLRLPRWVSVHESGEYSVRVIRRLDEFWVLARGD